MYENFYTKKDYEIRLQYVQEDSFSKKSLTFFYNNILIEFILPFRLRHILRYFS